jgi:hypothetical protein
MASRTYLIQFYWLVYYLSKYIGRWLPKMTENMDSQQAACVNALYTALQECLPLFQPAPPSG